MDGELALAVPPLELETDLISQLVLIWQPMLSNSSLTCWCALVALINHPFLVCS